MKDVVIRAGGSHDLNTIALLYKETDYGGGMSDQDRFVLAEHEGELIGVVRLSEEFEVTVLRGMRVKDSMQREGVGTLMLEATENMIAGKDCYCLPYRHLRDFYGQASFLEVDASFIPDGFRERFSKYRAMGLDIIVMHREQRAL